VPAIARIKHGQARNRFSEPRSGVVCSTYSRRAAVRGRTTSFGSSRVTPRRERRQPCCQRECPARRAVTPFYALPLTSPAWECSAPEQTLLVAARRTVRVRLFAFGLVCWPARSERRSGTRLGPLTGILTYDVAAAGLLAYAGWSLGLAGVALWPEVVLHAALAAWCSMCLGRG
jgi:hypothetical protein